MFRSNKSETAAIGAGPVEENGSRADSQGPHSIPAAAYLRRSTDHQEQSLADQRAAAHEYASSHGYRIAAEYVDDAVSGTSAKMRKGFLSMVEDAREGLFRTVIVWNSDRFSRGDVTETEHYRYLLREAGVTVVSITEDYLQKDGIEGDVLRTVKQFQNRQYSVSLAQNALRGMLSSFQEGDPGRRPPYGYDREILGPDGSLLYRMRNAPGDVREIYSPDGKLQGRYTNGQSFSKPSKECRGRLAPGREEEVRVVQRIFRLAIEGHGFSRIANRLNEEGVPSPRGGKWSHTTIKALLENPAYYGAAVFNRRTKAKFYGVRQGNITKSPDSPYTRLDNTEWLVREDAHPAILDKETWSAAQEAVKRRSNNAGGQGKAKNRYLLSGLLYCSDCGHLFWGRNRKNGRGYGRPKYHCSGRHSFGKSICGTSGGIACEDVEGLAIEVIKRAILSTHAEVAAAADAFVKMARAEQDAQGRGHRLKDIERALKEIETTIRGLTSRIDPENLELLNDRLSELRRRKEHLNAKREKLLRQLPNLTEEDLREMFMARAGMLQELLAGRSDETTREFLAQYITRIEYSPSKKEGVIFLEPGLEIPTDVQRERDRDEDVNARKRQDSGNTPVRQVALFEDAAESAREGENEAGTPMGYPGAHPGAHPPIEPDIGASSPARHPDTADACSVKNTTPGKPGVGCKCGAGERT